MFYGSLVALVTPMRSTGEVDYPAYKKLLQRHCDAPTSGIVVLGTTGESATLTPDERLRLIELAVAEVGGRKPVIVGTGTNATVSTLANTQQAAACGADGALVVNPYYNRPTQDGLYQHLMQTADSVDLPIILYNHPGRTGCNLSLETVERLAAHPNIVAIKEALAEHARYQALTALDLTLLGGNDDDALELCRVGGQGVVSVAANLIPDQMATLVRLVQQDFEAASALNQRLMPLFNGLALESNPIPIKFALQQAGQIESGIRLPMTWLSDESQVVLKKILDDEEFLCEV